MAKYRQFCWAGVLGIAWLGLLGSLPGQAQPSNFGDLTLSQAAPSGTARGTTAGIFALANLAQRDSQGSICTGFADTNPDHLLTLQEAFTQLTIRVDSGGNDTTLLIQGPSDNLIRCGEDTDRRNPDAQVQGPNWPAGTYRIWVGSHNQGQRYNYTLLVAP